MPVLEYTQETLPKTREEFVRLLESARQNADPLDDLLSLSRQLLTLEQRHDMTSDDFYVRYKRGELGDSMDFIRWAGRYRLYRELKDEINQSLTIVLTERVAVPA
ncbi:MAG: hypothetical protein NT169_13610 [Chloroflexi bacterium]|nr:hypothetical protein [Chloroflexota bacterium]